MDVCFADDALADVYPALFSHCSKKDATVREIFQSGLGPHLVPTLSQAAELELPLVEHVIASSELSEEPDRRHTLFSKNASGLDSGAIYQLLKARDQPTDERAQFVWRNVEPPRVQMFMWLLTQGRIKCRKVLHRKHVVPDAKCEICNEQDETPEHIMGGCSISSQFWHKIGLRPIAGMPMDNIHRFSPPPGVPREEFSALIALSCWQLWKTRSTAVFRNESHNINQVLVACKATADQWRCRFPRKKKHAMVPTV
jgi:hypothetical protein